MIYNNDCIIKTMNSSFAATGSGNKGQFLEDAKTARLERQKEKETQEAVVRIQSLVRGFISRNRMKKQLLQDLHLFILETLDQGDVKKDTVKIQEAFLSIRKFFVLFDPKRRRNEFDGICRYILSSILSATSSSSSYISVASNPKLTLVWIQQLKKILSFCILFLRELRPEITGDHKSMMLYLNMILTLTNPQVWKLSTEARTAMTVVCTKIIQDLMSKGLMLSLQSLLKKGLCRSRICLNKTELSAIISISLRPVMMLKNDTQVNLFLIHILSVPGLTYHMQSLAPESVAVMSSSLSLKEVCSFLEKDNHLTIVFNGLEGNYGLCLLANIVHWSCMDLKNITDNLLSLLVSKEL